MKCKHEYRLAREWYTEDDGEMTYIFYCIKCLSFEIKVK